jgi:hypothetical protein
VADGRLPLIDLDVVAEVRPYLTRVPSRLVKVMRSFTVGLLTALLTACGSAAPAPDDSLCPLPAYIPFPTSGWPCPPAVAMAAIDAVLALEFIDDPTAGTFVCHASEGSRDLTRLQERAYQALSLIERLEFDAPLPWTSQPLWTWFTGNIHRIQFLQTGRSNCCRSSDTMQIDVDAADQSGFPRMVLVLVHEARHADIGHSCGDKDSSIAALEPFGVEYYLALWLADHVTAPALTPAERVAARNASETLRTSAFCPPCGGT